MAPPKRTPTTPLGWPNHKRYPAVPEWCRDSNPWQTILETTCSWCYLSCDAGNIIKQMSNITDGEGLTRGSTIRKMEWMKSMQWTGWWRWGERWDVEGLPGSGWSRRVMGYTDGEIDDVIKVTNWRSKWVGSLWRKRRWWPARGVSFFCISIDCDHYLEYVAQHFIAWISSTAIEWVIIRGMVRDSGKG